MFELGFDAGGLAQMPGGQPLPRQAPLGNSRFPVEIVGDVHKAGPALAVGPKQIFLLGSAHLKTAYSLHLLRERPLRSDYGNACGAPRRTDFQR
ncbi:MAG TPA: hypothetical protein VH639_29265 [Bryobacteraceae bacterium]